MQGIIYRIREIIAGRHPMNKYWNLLADGLSRELERRNLGKGEFAKALKSPQSVISRLLQPDHDPRLSTIIEVSRALNLEPWELLKPEKSEPTEAEILANVIRTLDRQDVLASIRAMLDGFKVYVPLKDEYTSQYPSKDA